MIDHVPQQTGGVAVRLAGGVIARVDGDVHRRAGVGDRVAVALAARAGVGRGDRGGRPLLQHHAVDRDRGVGPEVEGVRVDFVGADADGGVGARRGQIHDGHRARSCRQTRQQHRQHSGCGHEGPSPDETVSCPHVLSSKRRLCDTTPDSSCGCAGGSAATSAPPGPATAHGLYYNGPASRPAQKNVTRRAILSRDRREPKTLAAGTTLRAASPSPQGLTMALSPGPKTIATPPRSRPDEIGS